MFYPEDIPLYKLAFAVLREVVKDACYLARRNLIIKINKTCDYLQDRLDDSRLRHQRLTSGQKPTFSRFHELPIELQQLIWQHVVLAYPSRTIEIRAQDQTKAGAESVVSSCQIPSPLHACRGSRHEALKYYSLGLGIANQPPKIFVNFHRDIIYFGARDEFFSLQNSSTDKIQDLEKIQQLAIRVPKYLYDTRWRLEALGSLKELVLVVQQGEREFDLGPNLTLVVGEAEDTLPEEAGIASSQQLEDVVGSLMYVPVVQGFFKKRQWDIPDWELPVLRQGYFVKGETDRWYFDRVGDPWPF